MSIAERADMMVSLISEDQVVPCRTTVSSRSYPSFTEERELRPINLTCRSRSTSFLAAVMKFGS